MAEALYQKYRPARFADVCGEQHVVKALQRAVAAGSFAHAYILYGPRGVGKTTIAKLLAKTVNCLSPAADGACGKCANCVRIATGQTMDVVELDAASNNGVAEIRSLIETVNYLPADLKRKVYILDEAHMLTVGAWNALLKTLEECPEHALFVFATTEQHKIPLTIISRCQCFGLRPLPTGLISGLLAKIAAAERLSVEDDALAALAALARGSARDAITMLDQLRAYAPPGTTLTRAHAESVFGLLSLDAKIAFVNRLAARDAEGAMSALDEFDAGGVNLGLLVSDLLTLFIDVYVYLHRSGPGALRVLDAESAPRIVMSGDDALACAEIFEELAGKIRFSPDVKANLQLAVFRALQKIAPPKPAEGRVSLAYGQMPPASAAPHLAAGGQSGAPGPKPRVAEEAKAAPTAAFEPAAPKPEPQAPEPRSEAEAAASKAKPEPDATTSVEPGQDAFAAANEPAKPKTPAAKKRKPAPDEPKQLSLFALGMVAPKPVEAPSVDLSPDQAKPSPANPPGVCAEKPSDPPPSDAGSKRLDAAKTVMTSPAGWVSADLRKKFCEIITARDDGLKAKFRESLKRLKTASGAPISSAINALRRAKDVCAASSRGIVFQYQDVEDAKTLNEHVYDPELIRYVYDQYGMPLIVVGFDMKTLKQLSKELQAAQERGEKFGELDNAAVLAITNGEKSTAEIAMEYFGDDLALEEK